MDTPQHFDIARVLTRTFGVLGRNARPFLGLSALLMWPSLFITLADAIQGRRIAAGTAPHAAPQPFVVVIAALLLVLLVFSYYAFQAALVEGTLAELGGERPRFGPCLSAGLRSFSTIFVPGVLALAGIMLGLALLIVPGLILATAWSVVVPVRLDEQKGISASLERSMALTEGYRWPIFVLFAIYFLFALLLALALRSLFGVTLWASNAATTGTAILVMAWAVRVAIAGLWAVGSASIYCELRLVKEGAAPAALAAAFD